MFAPTGTVAEAIPLSYWPHDRCVYQPGNSVVGRGKAVGIGGGVTVRYTVAHKGVPIGSVELPQGELTSGQLEPVSSYVSVRDALVVARVRSTPALVSARVPFGRAAGSDEHNP